ncbi:MAG: hypothetical protein QOG34_1820 [Frankiaceae bacterium]|nr:hypothetical protein [Frankiaceae bacterium]
MTESSDAASEENIRPDPADSSSGSEDPVGRPEQSHELNANSTPPEVRELLRGAADRSQLSDSELKLAVYLESRILHQIRRETGDPYAGLPADDVLMRLHQQFPEVQFPERMMRRLEVEQSERHELDKRAADLAEYEAETRRRDAAGDRKLQQEVGWRAVAVLVFLVAVGLTLIFSRHEGSGGLVLGGTLVGVLTALVGQKVGR